MTAVAIVFVVGRWKGVVLPRPNDVGQPYFEQTLFLVHTPRRLERTKMKQLVG
jgi:hypothetical protein